MASSAVLYPSASSSAFLSWYFSIFLSLEASSLPSSPSKEMVKSTIVAVLVLSLSTTMSGLSRESDPGSFLSILTLIPFPLGIPLSILSRAALCLSVVKPRFFGQELTTCGSDSCSYPQWRHFGSLLASHRLFPLSPMVFSLALNTKRQSAYLTYWPFHTKWLDRAFRLVWAITFP